MEGRICLQGRSCCLPFPIPGALHDLLSVAWPRWPCGLQPWDLHVQGVTHWPPSINGEWGGSLLQSRQFYPIVHQDGKPWFQPEEERNCSVLIWKSSLWMLQWPGYRIYRAVNHLNHLPQAAAMTWNHPLEWKEVKLSHTSNRKDQPHCPVFLNSTFYEVLQQKTDFKNHSNWNLELTMFL